MKPLDLASLLNLTKNHQHLIYFILHHLLPPPSSSSTSLKKNPNLQTNPKKIYQNFTFSQNLKSSHKIKISLDTPSRKIVLKIMGLFEVDRKSEIS
jgi:hypothetical protein